jgi:hypothetical protein
MTKEGIFLHFNALFLSCVAKQGKGDDQKKISSFFFSNFQSVAFSGGASLSLPRAMARLYFRKL